jgi:hypothetical protein
MPNNKISGDGLPGKANTEKHPKSILKKRTVSLSRWLHIYLSMVSFIIVLFFAVTGFTLNHADWFGNKPLIKKHSGRMNLKWVKTKDTSAIDKLNIVEFLRKTNGITGKVSDFRIDDGDVSVSFNGPGYAADTYIDRNTGEYKITETRFGLVAILNDLHKGRDAGKSWGIVIDITAILMTMISLTGIIMLCFIKKKRFKGLLLFLLGLAILYTVYHFLVS